MSEHIFETDGSSVVYVTDTMGLQDVTCAREEIVRCRDCAHFRETRMYDGSTGRRCSGVMAFIEPNPDGFCAWGERNE